MLTCDSAKFWRAGNLRSYFQKIKNKNYKEIQKQEQVCVNICQFILNMLLVGIMGKVSVGRDFTLKAFLP